MATVDTLEVEVCLKWSACLKDNLVPALSWLAETEWSQCGYCPECRGVSPANVRKYDVTLANYGPGHLSDCRLAAMMRIFGVAPVMFDEGEED